jgi:dienelactone hydrolase
MPRVTRRVASALKAYTRHELTHLTMRHDFYRRGEGRAVVIMHELPGLTWQVVRLADRVADAGFTAYVPRMFGVPGRPFLSTMAACVSREICAFASRRGSAITEWLRALCRHGHVECGGKGVGVIGMCLSGGFALATAADVSVMAPVTCEPALPIPALTRSRRRSLGITTAEQEVLTRRAGCDLEVLGFRFSADCISPGERFVAIENMLGSSFHGTTIDSSPGNRCGISRYAHPVLTTSFVDTAQHPTRQALDAILAFFRARLE